MRKEPTCKKWICKFVTIKEKSSTVKPKKKRKNGRREEHKEEMKEKQKKIREEHKNEYFACESCQMLVKNINVHNKTEYHNKNVNNGWKDDKEKKDFEHWQPIIIGLKKKSVDWKKDLENEKEN